MTTKNQETLIGKPVMSIITIDVWEHAYYLKHYNKRVDYIDDWFSVVDWKKAEERYLGFPILLY